MAGCHFVCTGVASHCGALDVENTQVSCTLGHNTVLFAKLGHMALYVFMLGVPTFGYLYSLASGYPVVWFGVIELPVLINKDPEFKELFKTLHELSGKGLVFLVAGHVLMALKHHVLDKDGILGRMVPGMRAD